MAMDADDVERTFRNTEVCKASRQAAWVGEWDFTGLPSSYNSCHLLSKYATYTQIIPGILYYTLYTLHLTVYTLHLTLYTLH
jgi:hypothetical protein